MFFGLLLFFSTALVALGISGTAVYFATQGVISEWVATLIFFSSWWYAGLRCLSYEQWKASGIRGTYFNPGNIQGAQMVFVWSFFGMFLSLFHAYLRSGVSYWTPNVRNGILAFLSR